ncbi:alpha/beta fold hydrolase [Inhella sp.]|uniref:alpha/beta fold hydrolase n=1 Tax=Inhella sp. TaxID=1921806 RepID=UPI0035AFD486
MSLPLVVALHSSAASGRQWQAYREASAGRLNWITPDLIGYGRDETWSSSVGVTLDQEVDRLAPHLLLPGQSFHLVGHSYGGAVALQFALRHPRAVRSLTLYEPVRFAALRQAGLQSEWREIRSLAARVRQRSLAGDWQGAARAFLGFWSGRPEDALDARTVMSVGARCPKVCADFDALFNDTVPLRLLGALQMPVRLLVGSESPAPARAVAQVLELAMPQADLQELPGLDHLAPLRASAGLQSLLTAFAQQEHLLAA